MPTRSGPWPAGTRAGVDLVVRDVAAAAAFHGAVFGWPWSPARTTATTSPAGSTVTPRRGIAPRREQNRPAAWTVYLASDDVDATAAAITGNGGACSRRRSPGRAIAG